MTARLTRDPSVSYPNDKAFARFSIAVDKRFKREGGATADFFNCIAYGKTAELIEKSFKKGNKIGITGRIENNEYKDKDGNTVKTNQIIVENIDFLESKAQAEQSQAQAQTQTQTQARPDPNEFIPVSDSLEDELPFV